MPRRRVILLRRFDRYKVKVIADANVDVLTTTRTKCGMKRANPELCGGFRIDVRICHARSVHVLNLRKIFVGCWVGARVVHWTM